MKIEKPTNTPPLSNKGRHKVIWAAVEKLNDGEWLPITCSTREEADSVANCARSSRSEKLKARKRGLTVFISRKKP